MVQATLTIDRPGDRYEQEADRIADQVMRMPEPQVQRQALPEGEEADESPQVKPLSSRTPPLVQRETDDEDEDRRDTVHLGTVGLTGLSPMSPEGSGGREYAGPTAVSAEEGRMPGSWSPRNWAPDAETRQQWRLEPLRRIRPPQETQPLELAGAAARDALDAMVEGIALKRGVNPSLLKKVVRSGLKALGKKALDAMVKEMAPSPEAEEGLKKDLDALWKERRRLEKVTNISSVKKDEALQRQSLTDEEVQADRRAGQRPAVTSSVEAAIQRARQEAGKPIHPPMRAFMESRFGHDFGHVRVHTGPRASEAAHTVHARAFTIGSDVIFGQGQHQPETTAGRRLLAHELTHVVQQAGGDTHLLAQRASIAQGAARVEKGGARGLDNRELDTRVQLPVGLKPHVQQRHSRTRTLSLHIDETLPGKTAVSEISRLYLLEGDEAHAAALAVEYSLRVSPELAADEKSWNQDTVAVGGAAPALRPHEEAHLRVKQLAIRSELGRHPEVESVASLNDALRVLQDSASRSKEIEGFVGAKMDVRTHHGEAFRPEKRFERERKIVREIQRAERLRDRNKARFTRRMKRFEASSAAALPEELRK
jgi:hypothetical protein